MNIEYISAADAARKKSCTRPTVYKAIDQGKLDTETVAGRRVIIVNQRFNDWTPKK